MAKFEFKTKVFEMRRRGISLGDIAKSIGLSKSTISIWCSEIELNEEQKNKISEKAIKSGMKGRLLGAESNRNKKIKSIDEAKEWASQKIVGISSKEYMIANIALYWAEGSKKNKSGYIFVNSDPDMVLFVYNWLSQYMGIKNDFFSPRVSVNIIHKERISQILNYWSNLLELPIEAFGNPYYVKSVHKKRYENHEKYYGVLRLNVKRSSMLKYKILALIEELKNKAVYNCRRSSDG